MQEELVAGRMRITHSVPKHCEYMRSSYPSEPILAEAAASIWAERQESGKAIPKTLNKLIKTTNIIGKGERGELVARLILTLAYDAAVKQCKAGEEQHTLAVPLETFLQELFGETNYVLIPNSKPHIGSLTFREAFKDAQVRFTHFVRAEDGRAVTTEAAYAAILRSMAFQCSHDQEDIDILVPLALKNGALREDVMSGMLIQIKNRVKSGTKASVYIDASKLSFFPESQKLFDDTNLRPYITLVMELGVSPMPKTLEAEGLVQVAEPNCARSLRKPQEPVNPRYSIFAYGCSPSLYKVVTSEGLFASLLVSRTLLAEHPRQTESCLEAVKEQKPFWSHGAESYGWLKDVGALHNMVFPEEAEMGMDGMDIDSESDSAVL